MTFQCSRPCWRRLSQRRSPTCLINARYGRSRLLRSSDEHGSFVFGGSSGLEGFTKDNHTPVTSSMTAPCICRGNYQNIFRCCAMQKLCGHGPGWMDLCADKVPVISPVEEVPGLILACGFSGHGFGISPAVGLILSQMVSGEETALDMTALRYDRFKAKDLKA